MNREILFEYFITRKNNKENIHLKFILKKNIQLKYLITRVVQDRINIWNNVNNILLHIETNYYYYYKLIFSRKIQKIFLSLIFFFPLKFKNTIAQNCRYLIISSFGQWQNSLHSSNLCSLQLSFLLIFWTMPMINRIISLYLVSW